MSRTKVWILITVLGSAVGLEAQARSSAATIEVIGGPHAGKYTLAATDVGCMISDRKGVKQFGSKTAFINKDTSLLSGG